MNQSRLWLFVVLVMGAIQSISTYAQEAYNPLVLRTETTSPPVDFTITDDTRDREIPIRIYLPVKTDSAPIILFSHGLGGSRRGCSYLGKHWSGRGYVVVFLQHAGTDESVWKGVAIRDRLNALKSAPSGKGSIDRLNDVRIVLDRLDNWNRSGDHQLHHRLDIEKVGMSGHSYGASTTQGVSGQSAPRIGQRFTDRRIDAAVMFSPNRPQRVEPDVAFGKVSIPWMLMTGTKDTSMINDTTVEDRRSVYPALPTTIDKYELVLHEAEHHAFSDGQSGRRRNRNPNHHRVILALSTAFWDTHLKADSKAKRWLHGDKPKGLMEANDSWQLSDKAHP